jgi:hypothetical protein
LSMLDLQYEAVGTAEFKPRFVRFTGIIIISHDRELGNPYEMSKI